MNNFMDFVFTGKEIEFMINGIKYSLPANSENDITVLNALVYYVQHANDSLLNNLRKEVIDSRKQGYLEGYYDSSVNLYEKLSD